MSFYRYRKQIQLDGNPVVVEILDTAGREDYREIRIRNIRFGKGAILMYSIINRNSLNEVDEFHKLIEEIQGKTFPSK